MPVIAELPEMAEKKTGRPKGERDDVTVKIDRRIVSMAKFIASKDGVSVAQLLSGLLDKPIRQRHAKLVLESQAELKDEEN